MSGEVDRYPVKQLPERYNLARSAFYKRMEALGIKPKRIGTRSYVSAEDVAQLDELHRFVKGGGSAPEFVEMMGLNKSSKPEGSTSEQSSGLTKVPNDMVNLIKVITAEIVANINPPANQVDPMAYYEVLERAAQNKWQLKSSEVGKLLDRSTDELERIGLSFSEAGFVFTQVGRRSSGEVAWLVSKP